MNNDEYLKNPMEIGLDKDWTRRRRKFDQRIKAQGIYIIHVSNPLRTLYIGKTRGVTMDFATRLYRHATKSASGNSKVYQALKKAEQETGGPILVSLVTTEQTRRLFEGKHLKDDAMIDIYDQVLIHVLKPEVQK